MYNISMKQKRLLSKLSLIIILFVMIISIPCISYSQESQGRETGSSSSGVPKNVLIELFINAECTSCPKAAFCLEELAWSYEPGRVILVEAHIWGDGHDIPETNARYDWYAGDGVKGTPDAFFNGLSERIQGLCCDCGDIDDNISAYQRIIDDQLAKYSPVKINAKFSICGGKFIVQGDIANESHSMLHNMILSGMVYYEGDESELFYLVKDIFENQDICQLAPMEKKNFSFISGLNLGELGDDELNKLCSVVFIQDRLTKEVVQSFLIQ